MRVREAVCWFWGALFLVGCGTSDDEPPVLTDGCDIREAECQRETFASAMRVRGQLGLRMPPVHTISLSEFEELLSYGGGDAGETEAWDTALSLLALLPPESTIGEEAAASEAANVAAFYDPETKEVTVIDRGESDPVDDVFVLAHEFAHFLQDAERPLVAFQEQWADSTDAMIALHALIEGEATVVGLGVVAEALEATLAQLNWSLALSSLRNGIFAAIDESPAPFITAVQTLPYPLGTEQVAPLWLAGGSGAVDVLYEQPRLSVLDWTEDTRVTLASRLELLECEPTLGPPGFAAVDWDRFGPAGVLGLSMTAGFDALVAWNAALGFRGDRVVLFEEEGTPGSFAVAWRVRFGTESGAESFRNRANAVLETGTAVLEGREVTVFASTDPENLEAWLEGDHCGTVDELPASPAPTKRDAALRRKLGRARLHGF